ncbi:MAG: FG-GAP-like repeat-containing protein [Bryobacteraceae bacterium]
MRLLFITLLAIATQAQQPSFQTGVRYRTGSGATVPISIVSADFNGDGIADLAVLNLGGNSSGPTGGGVSVLIANGDGSFKQPVSYSAPSGCAPYYIATGDFLGDGNQDLLLVCGLSTELVVFPGNGDGTFGTAVVSQASLDPLVYADFLRIAVGDFNGDGKADLVVLSYDPTASTIASNPYFLPGNGDGTFGTAVRIAGAVGSSLSAGDFNRDGKLDLVVSAPANLSFSLLTGTLPAPGPITVLLGNGDGTFTVGASYQPGFGPGPVAVGDLNGDGIPDLVVSSYTQGFAVYIGKGDGTFTQTFNDAEAGAGGTLGYPALADLFGTGNPGVIVPVLGCCESTIGILPGNGDGTFQPLVGFLTGIASPSVVAADFSNDNKADLALIDYGSVIAFGNLLGAAHADRSPPQSTDAVVLLNNTRTPFPFRNQSAASYAYAPFASNSIVAAFGGNLATGTGPATTTPLPTVLHGANVGVKDSAGKSRSAPLTYASPGQVNYIVPAGTAAGKATVTISAGSSTSTATVTIAPVASALFTMNPAGLVAAYVIRVKADGSSDVESAFQVSASQRVVALPIDLGAATDQVFLEMFGTGSQNGKTVTVTVGRVSVPVTYAGVSGYAGEDQVNIGPLPRSLAGKGQVEILMTVDGIAANVTNVSIQ